jgi:hypothetical protein
MGSSKRTEPQHHDVRNFNECSYQVIDRQWRVTKYLESIPHIHNEGGVVRPDADPLAVPEHLQPAHLVLENDGHYLGVRVTVDPKHLGRVRACRVVVHPRVAHGIRRFQLRERVRLQAKALG